MQLECNKVLKNQKNINYLLIKDFYQVQETWTNSFSSAIDCRQKYTRRRFFLQYLNSDFLFYLGWSGSLSTKQAKNNEGCSKINYLLAEV